MTYIYAIGWALAAIAIVAFIHKAADNTCPTCHGNGLVLERDCGFSKCKDCKGEGKI